MAFAATPAFVHGRPHDLGATLVRDAVINGNLVAPFDPGKRFSPSEAAQVRAAGLTALKLMLGGADMDRATTFAQVVRLHQEIALNGDLFSLVRAPHDIAAWGARLCPERIRPASRST